MLILDTSFLFAFFQQNDNQHDDAVGLTASFKNDVVYFPFLVFQELMTLIMSRYSSSEAIRICEIILDKDFPAQILKIDEEYFEQSVDLFKKLGKHKFSFVDVSLIVLARELGAKIITFDERLEKETAGSL